MFHPWEAVEVVNLGTEMFYSVLVHKLVRGQKPLSWIIPDLDGRSSLRPYKWGECWNSWRMIQSGRRGNFAITKKSGSRVQFR
jgi:hypothetical protein